MFRLISVLLGFGLLVLGVFGLSQPVAHLVAWLDVAAAVAAFTIAGAMTWRSSTSKLMGAPLTLGVGLLLLWFVSFAAGAPVWLTWWNFFMGAAFCFLGLSTSWSEEDFRFSRRDARGPHYNVYPWDPFATGRIPLAGGSGQRRGPKSYQRADTRIHEDICDRLWDQWDIDATDIEVRVQSGEVTLEGLVENRWAKRHAESIADSVSGVHDVHNLLRTKRPGALSTPGPLRSLRSSSTSSQERH